ncbi:hypothetical protein V8F06_002930 [Rhypophila decipiens]
MSDSGPAGNSTGAGAGGPPPPGAVPVFPPISGENNKDELINSLAVVASFATAMMALRYFCKIRYAKGFGIDDIFLLIGWMFLIISIVLECLATNYGLGLHFTDILQDMSKLMQLPQANKYLFVGEFFGILGISFAKTSFCFTILRLCVQKWHKALIWFCIVTVNLVMWPCAISFFVGCTPVEKKFDDSVPGHCINTQPIIDFAVFAGVYSAVTDFILAIFPWFLIWNLQMRLVEKLGVCVCMSMGILSGVFAIVKSAHLPNSLADYTWLSTPLLIWSGAELAIVIMASSIPFLRLFWKEMKEKTTSARSRNKTGYANTGYKLDSVHSKMGTHSRIQRSQKGTTNSKTLVDDSSDKSILAQSKNMAGIMRSTEVVVETESTKGEYPGQLGVDMKNGSKNTSHRSFYNGDDAV